MGVGIDAKNRMAARAAEEIQDGMVVNLGIGIPSLVPNFLPKERKVLFHAENGILGMGPSPIQGKEDANLCNAGGFPVTLNKDGSYCDSANAFAIIRRGKIDLTILGSLQVSQSGDLANWIVPGRKIPGMGGAIDLAQKAKRVVVVMSQCDKQRRPKLVESCSLPLTAKGCVNVIITEMAVYKVTDTGLHLIELFEPYGVKDVINQTDCKVHVSGSLRTIR